MSKYDDLLALETPTKNKYEDLIALENESTPTPQPELDESTLSNLPGAFADVAGTIGRNVAAGGQGLLSSAGGLMRGVGENPKAFQAVTGMMPGLGVANVVASAIPKSAYKNISDYGKVVDKYYKEAAQNMVQKLPESTKTSLLGEKPGVINWKEFANPDWWVSAIGETVGGILPILTGPAAPAVFAASSMGESYNKMRDGNPEQGIKPMEPTEAAIRSAAVGAITGALMEFNVSKMIKNAGNSRVKRMLSQALTNAVMMPGTSLGTVLAEQVGAEGYELPDVAKNVLNAMWKSLGQAGFWTGLGALSGARGPRQKRQGIMPPPLPVEQKNARLAAVTEQAVNEAKSTTMAPEGTLVHDLMVQRKVNKTMPGLIDSIQESLAPETITANWIEPESRTRPVTAQAEEVAYQPETYGETTEGGYAPARVEEPTLAAMPAETKTVQPKPVELAQKPMEAKPPEGMAAVRHAWEMTRDELQTELESATDKESLDRIRPLLAEVFPEYVGVDYRDFNQDPWGIGRAIQVGTELPRIPTIDLTKRHNALVSAAPAAKPESAKPPEMMTPAERLPGKDANKDDLVKELADAGTTENRMTGKKTKNMNKVQLFYMVGELRKKQETEHAIPERKTETLPLGERTGDSGKMVEEVRNAETLANVQEQGKAAEAGAKPTAEAQAANARPDLTEGSRVIIKGNPQPYTIDKILPWNEGDLPTERFYEIRNEKTGKTETVESADLVKTKPKAEGEQVKRDRRVELDETLKSMGVNNPEFYKTIPQKVDAIKRLKAKGVKAVKAYNRGERQYMGTRSGGAQSVSFHNPMEPAKGPDTIQQIESWADKTIKESKSRLGMSGLGIDPNLALAYASKGAILIGRGVKNFTEWSKEMVKEHSEKIRPYLKDIWKQANEMSKRWESQVVAKGAGILKEKAGELAPKTSPKTLKGLINKTYEIGGKAKYLNKKAKAEEILEFIKKNVPEDYTEATISTLKQLAKDKPRLDIIESANRKVALRHWAETFTEAKTAKWRPDIQPYAERILSEFRSNGDATAIAEALANLREKIKDQPWYEMLDEDTAKDLDAISKDAQATLTYRSKIDNMTLPDIQYVDSVLRKILNMNTEQVAKHFEKMKAEFDSEVQDAIDSAKKIHGKDKFVEQAGEPPKRPSKLKRLIGIRSRMDMDNLIREWAGEGSKFLKLGYDKISNAMSEKTGIENNAWDALSERTKLTPKDLLEMSRTAHDAGWASRLQSFLHFRADLKPVVTMLPTATILSDRQGAKPVRATSQKMTMAERITLLAYSRDPWVADRLTDPENPTPIRMSLNPKAGRIFLTDADLAAIEKQATPLERKIAEFMVDYNANEMRNVFEEGALKLLGYRQPARGRMFPVRRYYKDRQIDPSKEFNDYMKDNLEVRHAGTFKSRAGGDASIIIGDAFDVFSSHVSTVASRAKMQPAVDLARRVLGDRNVQAEIEARNRHGDELIAMQQDILDKLVAMRKPDLGPFNNAISGLIRNVHGATLTMKPHIAIGQMVGTNNLLIDMKASDIMAGITKASTPAGVGQAKTVIKKYAPLLYRRITGAGFDLATAGTSNRTAIEGMGAKGDVLSEIGKGMIQSGDNAVSYVAFHAAMNEGMKKGLKGDALEKYAAERAQQVVRDTQAGYDPLNISTMMHNANDNPMLKLFSGMSFNTETNRARNLVIRQLYRFRDSNKTAGDIARLARTFAVVASNQVVYGAVRVGSLALLGILLKTIFGTEKEDAKDSMKRNARNYLSDTIANLVQVIPSGAVSAEALRQWLRPATEKTWGKSGQEIVFANPAASELGNVADSVIKIGQIWLKEPTGREHKTRIEKTETQLFRLGTAAASLARLPGSLARQVKSMIYPSKPVGKKTGVNIESLGATKLE